MKEESKRFVEKGHKLGLSPKSEAVERKVFLKKERCLVWFVVDFPLWEKEDHSKNVELHEC